MSRDVVKLYWPAEQCSVSALSKHAVKRNCPYIIIDDSHGFSSVSKYRGNREANTAHAVLQLIPKKVSQRNCFTDAVFKCVQRIREFVYRREFGRDPKTRLNTNVIPPSYLTSAVLPIVGKRDSPAIIRPRASNLYPLGLIRDVWPNAANWPYLEISRLALNHAKRCARWKFGTVPGRSSDHFNRAQVSRRSNLPANNFIPFDNLRLSLESSICVLVYFAINKIRRVNFLSISFLSRTKLLPVETRDARACAAKSKSSSQERLKKFVSLFVSNLENSGRPRFVRFLECFQKPYRSNPKIFS